ncbi:MAG TPA: LysR substrate-binding domain-containing protein [Ramlibacter sp.]|nr:LysR substrate-binding domain-containing protein [Ramlibacter sp.]
MDFKQLKYFTRIAELGNMTRASEALHVAQPALTQQISNLENELETRVFDRSHSGMKLTAAGDVLYHYAKSLLRQLDDARVAVREESMEPGGGVTVGMPGSTGKLVAVPLLSALASHDRIVLEIVERPSAELMSLVARGRVDMAIVVDEQPCRGATTTPLLVEELYVIAPHSQAGKGSIGLKELAAQPLVLPSLPSTIRQRVDASFLNEHLKYRLVGEVSSTDMLLRIVAAGLGWTMLPWSAVGEEAARGMVSALPLTKIRLTRELSLAVSDSVPLSQPAEIVRRHLLSILEKLAASRKWRGSEWISPASADSAPR